ncbi:MAG TPA: Hsp33 family molecular chaperone HslO [Gammaproteobacteria bacterium]|nr:Hsp33 family molecular chaperone HslO [Gammaproteobacteria bacterium]
MTPESDSLQRFVFEHLAVRGELVHLDATWQAILARHDYPQPVRDLLGQMMAAAALLSATLKFDGAMTLQVQGGGPITLMVVEVTAERTLRGMAHWEGELTEGPLESLVGAGRLLITIDPGGGRERYQGIVELTGASLSEALDAYLAQSEQLDTRLWLAADGQAAGGLLIQRLPDEAGAEDKDAWQRISLLSETVRPDELLGLHAREIIHRLFHEEDVRVFETEPVCFRCSCSRERVANMLRTLGRDEVNDILDEQGSIEVTCEFCNQHYSFDTVDAEQLFASDISPEIPKTRH